MGRRGIMPTDSRAQASEPHRHGFLGGASPFAAASLALVLLAAAPAAAQLAWDPSVRLVGSALVPVLGDEAFFDTGFRGLAFLENPLFSGLAPFVYAGTSIAPASGVANLTLLEGGAGLGLSYDPVPRLRLGLAGMAGIWNTRWQETAYSGYSFGAFAETGFRLSPAITLSLNAGFGRYAGSAQPLLDAATLGASVSFDLDGFRSDATRIRIDAVDVSAVFPVFYSYYDRNSFGSVSFTNLEETEITDVKVSFYLPRFMGRPKPCAEFASIPKGGSTEARLYAIFNDQVLYLTEGVAAEAEIIIEYRLLGSKRSRSEPVVLRMHHRNAMTWQDDRSAAAFVSPKDPAVLWMSRFSGAIVRDRFRTGVNRNLQYALGAFETVRLFGINYVVDPASSYVEKAANAETVDYLQYPYQTLSYRGGDCDDLSILFCSLMESAGIQTALITVPGHIYMAFSLGIGEKEAAATFADPGSYVVRDGIAWAPVEITMVKDGFVKAWRVGAKEWYDNDRNGRAAFYPVETAWKTYPSVGVPDVKARFDLPDEAETILAFDSALNRHVAREIDPEIKKVRAAGAGLPAPELANRIGIAYARFAMLKDAWDSFSEAAKADYEPAWTNLANVAFLRKDYELALGYYRWAIKLDPGDSAAWLGAARCDFELERFDASGASYASLMALDPELAGEYGYLASMLGGEGRAWSFADRLSRTVWAPAPRPVPVVVKEEPKPAAREVPVPAAPTSASVAAVPEEPIPGAAPAVVPEAPTAEPPASPEPAPAEAVAATPAAAPEPAPVAETPPSAPEPLPVAKAEPEPAAPPAIAQEVPEDKDLPPAQAPAPIEPAASPAISQALPNDRDLPPAPAPVERTPAATIPAPVASPAPESVGPTVEPEPQPTIALPVVEPPATAMEPVMEPSVAGIEPVVEPPAAGIEPVEQPAVAEPAAVPEAPVETRPAAPIATYETIARGFAATRPLMGSWTVSRNSAKQTDPTQYFAKLGLPLVQGLSPVRYSFSAKSTGTGWVGVGLHVYVHGSATDFGYGQGDSFLVWLTRDPYHNGDRATRLQLYRSTSDVDMEMTASVVVPKSIFARTTVTIDVDPSDGSLVVSLDGRERLRTDKLGNLGGGLAAVFRSIDTAEFGDFSVEERR
ncbi:MAG: hypothetical protein NT080_00615 [Spirochaetes bacterium]|nr:hypothetical protein [Spirochaetota bacterium]